MKMFTILAATAALLPTAAFAQASPTAPAPANVEISATVPRLCDIKLPTGSVSVDLVGGQTAKSIGSIDATCNFSGTDGGPGGLATSGLVISVSTTNGGLVNPADATKRPYDIIVTDFNGSTWPVAASTTAYNWGGDSWLTTANTLVSRPVAVSVPAAALTVAGTYSDTVVVAVSF